MQRIFISYSRKDSAFVRTLAGDLEKAGYDVWWDVSDLRGGDDWLRVIPTAIESSDYVIVVLSPNAVISEWVEKEYTQALGLRKKIIPIMLARSSVPFALNTINYINFAAGEYAENFKKLLTALGYTGEAPVSRPTPAISFPPALRIAVIGIVILGLLFLLTRALISAPEPDPTPSPTLPRPTTPPTLTREPATSTITSTITLTVSPTSTLTETPTPRPTDTASPTSPPFELLLKICLDVALDVHNVNVRSGPGTNYAPLGEPLSVLDDAGQNVCLWFRARSEDDLWFVVAPNQPDPEFRQYEGGWLRRDLLGISLMGPLPPGLLVLPAITLTPTPAPSETPTASLTPSRTPTLTLTPTDTPSPTATETDTPTPSETPTP
jgi:TIR domain-containing protein